MLADFNLVVMNIDRQNAKFSSYTVWQLRVHFICAIVLRCKKFHFHTNPQYTSMHLYSTNTLFCATVGTIYSNARSVHEEWPRVCTGVLYHISSNLQWFVRLEGANPQGQRPRWCEYCGEVVVLVFMQYSSWKVTVVLTGNLTDAHKYQISTSNGVDVTCGCLWSVRDIRKNTIYYLWLLPSWTLIL